MEEFLDATVKNIELGRHRRARIWLGSLPDAAYRSPGKLTRSWVASLAPPVANRSAAVELLVPKGADSLTAFWVAYSRKLPSRSS